MNGVRIQENGERDDRLSKYLPTLWGTVAKGRRPADYPRRERLIDSSVVAILVALISAGIAILRYGNRG